MKPKALLSVAVAICVGAAGAQAENTKESKAALGQLKGIEKTSGDAAKDANQGKLGPAKEKAARGFDTPVSSTTTPKGQSSKAPDVKKVSPPENVAQKRALDKAAPSTTTPKGQPSKAPDAKEVAARENAAQKARDRETAKKYRLDDPKKAPPKL